jgi:membrane carboxypeptidase/penicillin-binding protein
MRPYFIDHITDRDGNVIEQATPRASDALRADTAFIMTSLLRGVAERGTAARVRRLKRPIAGKTGTTNDFTDAWFIGFEPSLAAAVWVGFDEKKDSLGRGETGSEAALPIWMSFWAAATADRPVEEYPIPGNVVFVPVDEMGRRDAGRTHGGVRRGHGAPGHGRRRNAPPPASVQPLGREESALSAGGDSPGSGRSRRRRSRARPGRPRDAACRSRTPPSRSRRRPARCRPGSRPGRS